MSTAPSLFDNNPFGNILQALDDEDFELVAETTRNYLSQHERGAGTDGDSYQPYAKYLNLLANGYRRWQISYNYTEIRNYFYAANWELSKAFRDEIPILVQAFYALTEMLNAYTRCENSFINDDPLALEHYAMEAQKAEKKGLEVLRPFHTNDPIVKPIKEWLQSYFEKNFQLHTGLEACAQIYSRIFKHEPCAERLFFDRIGAAQNALAELGLPKPGKPSIELASELNAHIRFIKQHYERTNGPLAEAGLTFLRLQEGTVTLCLSAGCDPNAARDIIIAKSGEFKKRLKHQFDFCGLEMTNFRAVPLHDIFQTSFGSHFLQMLTFNLPSITVVVSDYLKRSYKFDVQVKLTSLGSCTVYLSHEVKDPGLNVEEVRMLQSLICPHAGQVTIQIDSSSPVSKTLPLPSYKFRERFEFAALDDLAVLEQRLHKSARARESLSQCQSARGQLERVIDEFVRHASFAAEPPSDDDPDLRPDQQPLFKQMNELCKLLQTSYAAEPGDDVMKRCQQLTYVTDFAAWILDSVGRAFRHGAKEENSKDEYERDRRWLVSRDTGWYGYVYARSLHLKDSQGKPDVTVDSFETQTVKEHPDIRGFLIEPREARASFDDWRFMPFRWKNYPNLALIRSHPCDAFFASENRAFLYFPDDPKFLADQYEVTVELMIWLGTALKFCERLSQRLVQDVSNCLNADGSGLDEGNVTKHLDWISRLRVQAGAVQALVSQTGISRYADHGELMTRMVENMKFLRIVELLDRRLSQFDQFYQKVKDEATYVAENRARLTDFLIIVIAAIVAIPAAIPEMLRSNSEGVRISLVVVIVILIGILLNVRLSKNPFISRIYRGIGSFINRIC